MRRFVLERVPVERFAEDDERRLVLPVREREAVPERDELPEREDVPERDFERPDDPPERGPLVKARARELPDDERFFLPREEEPELAERFFDEEVFLRERAGSRSQKS